MAVGFFVFSSLLFRLLIPFDENADYHPYAFLRTYEYSLSRPFDDPFLKLIYNTFYYISYQSKSFAIKAMYWTVFVICNSFFVFLMKDKNLILYKKILFFSLYYFLFSYTLLRNGPSYVLVALFFYYFLNSEKHVRKTKCLVASLAFHYSSLTILIINFLSSLKVKQIVITFLIFSIVSFAIISGLDISFDLIVNKFNTYLNLTKQPKLFHIIWFYFICGVFMLSFIENRNLAMKKFNIWIFFCFLIMYYINHVAGFRFSVYYLLYYLLMNPSNKLILNNKKLINIFSFLSIMYFIFSFFDTHNR